MYRLHTFLSQFCKCRYNVDSENVSQISAASDQCSKCISLGYSTGAFNNFLFGKSTILTIENTA